MAQRQNSAIGDRPGSLLNELPFVYSLCSYIYNITHVIDELVKEFKNHSTEFNTLELVHLHPEQILELTTS